MIGRPTELQRNLTVTEATQEEASTHESAKTHAGNWQCFMTQDLDFGPFDLKINGFPLFRTHP